MVTTSAGGLDTTATPACVAACLDLSNSWLANLPPGVSCQ